jgi:hypothetical protein
MTSVAGTADAGERSPVGADGAAESSSADLSPVEDEAQDAVVAADQPEWHVIRCPSNIELTSVGKERGTHGFIYTLWEIERRLPVWVSQSIPAVVKAINDKAVLAHEKRLHASSIYRVLRGESQKRLHKGFQTSRWSRTSLVELNGHLQSFPSCIFVSKSPEAWYFETTSEGGRAAPAE